MGSDDWLSHLIDGIQPKCEKASPPPLSHQKLLMIGQVIQATKVNRNAKKAP